MEVGIMVYNAAEISRLGDEDFKKIAACYQKVFNAHWHENWTLETALAEVRKSLAIVSGRSPLLSLLWDGDKIVGFAWIILTDINHVFDDDMPFDLSKAEKGRGIEVVKYWCRLIDRKKIVIYKELGIFKEYRAYRGVHMASKLSLPIARKAYDAGYRTLFYWTNPHNSTYKQGIGFEWYPIYYFTKHDRVILKGGIQKLIYYLEGILDNDKAILRAMKDNRRHYFDR